MQLHELGLVLIICNVLAYAVCILIVKDSDHIHDSKCLLAQLISVLLEEITTCNLFSSFQQWMYCFNSVGHCGAEIKVSQ